MDANAESNLQSAEYTKIYHAILFPYSYVTFCLPFVFAMLTFYTWYSLKFLSLPPRLRNKKLAVL